MRKKIPLIGGIINLIESLKGDIGIIENTDVATHSISAGSYVIWHNELYKASSAIAVDDALSSSNLTAVSGGAANELKNNINRYSSSEIECGTWVDGKTLYRKVITFTTGSTTEAWLAQSHNISNVANMRITCAYINTSNGGNEAVPSTHFQIGATSTQFKYVIHNSSYSGKEIVVIVEYTKT